MPLNPEHGILNNIYSQFEKRPLIRAAHEKAQNTFSGDSIKMDEFADLYAPEMIASDKEKIDRIRKTFQNSESEKGNKMAADILEAIIFEHTELSEWFGEHAHTIRTTAFDDIINGVDLVVEFNEPQRSASHLALGVDATFGASTIQKKFQRIKDEIKSGGLAEIKYFKSANNNFHGRIRNIPRIVVGIERENLVELTGMWIRNEKKELGAHPMQRIMLEEAKVQLTAFAAYARAMKQDALDRPFAETLGIIDELLRSKANVSLGTLRDDRVYQEIRAHLDMFKV